MTEYNNFYGNRIIYVYNNGKEEIIDGLPNLKINFNGKYSTVKIYEPIKIRKDLSIDIYTGGFVEIKKECNIRSLYVNILNNSLTIGERVYIGQCLIYAHREKNIKVSIGDDCLISLGVTIRASDEHTIFNLDNPDIPINKAYSGIHIGNHVWIGDGSFIGKDVIIANNCIIGARSFINKKFLEENCIIAGVPGKIIRKNIGWDRRAIFKFEDDHKI